MNDKVVLKVVLNLKEKKLPKLLYTVLLSNGT